MSRPFRFVFGAAGADLDESWTALAPRERRRVELTLRPLFPSYDRLRDFVFRNRAFSVAGLSAEARTACAFLAVGILATKHAERMREGDTTE